LGRTALAAHRAGPGLVYGVVVGSRKQDCCCSHDESERLEWRRCACEEDWGDCPQGVTMFRLPAALLLLALPAPAQKAGTVDEIAALIRAGLAHKRSDAKIAKSLRNIRPSQRIDEEFIEGMEGEGAGPETVAELERLRGLSGGLPSGQPSPEL